MYRPHTIRAKLALVIVAAVAVAQLALAGVGAWLEAQRYAAQKSDTLVATAQVLAAASADAVAKRSVGGAYAALRAAGKAPGVDYVEVRTIDGAVLAEIGAAGQLVSDLRIDARAPQLDVARLVRSRSLQVQAPIVQGGVEVGSLTLVAGLRDLAPRLRAAVLQSLAGGAATLIVALLVAWRGLGRVTAPVLGLAETMRRVRASHDYRVKLETTSRDEVGTLIAGFNTMIDDIHERDLRLRRHMEELEQEVAERTRDYREAAAEADAANRAKSDFLATMSHEIRTPMNGVMVMAELLAGCDLPARARRHADVIAKSGQSLLAIINDILDLSKIEAGKLEVETLDVDPVEAAETVLRLFAERARGKGLDLAGRMETAPGALVVADPVRLGQVLANLVNNALKFTEKGSVTLEVAREGERVVFRVVDSGVGIPADKLASVFDAFSQADQTTTRRFGGTGLGLAIGKKLVVAMGGDLAATSEEGRGSIFFFSLPLAEASRALEPPRPPEAGGAAYVRLADATTGESARLYFSAMGFVEEGGAPVVALLDAAQLRAHGRPPLAERGVVAAIADPATPADDLVASGVADFALQFPLSRAEMFEIGAWMRAGRPGRTTQTSGPAQAWPNYATARVLVADDSAVNLEVAQGALARFGITPTCVADGRQAWEACRREAFDLVLMDGSMPDMDGFEAALAIRADEREKGAKRTPIVALTAHVVGAAAEQWRHADMDGVLHKPYTLARLAEALAQHLTGAAPAAAVAPAAEAAKPTPKLLDAAALEGLREMSGDPGLVERVARLYCVTAPQRLAELSLALERADLKAQASAAHALKSMSLNIGAAAVAALAQSIEHDAREAKKPPSEEDVERLRRLAEETFALLRPKAA